MFSRGSSLKKTSVVSLPVVILSIHTILCQISELIAVLAGEQKAERAKLVCSLCSLMFTFNVLSFNHQRPGQRCSRGHYLRCFIALKLKLSSLAFFILSGGSRPNCTLRQP